MTPIDSKITFGDPPKPNYKTDSLAKALFEAAKTRPGEWASATIPAGSYAYWALKYASENVQVVTRHNRIESGRKVCDAYVKFPGF